MKQLCVLLLMAISAILFSCSSNSGDDKTANNSSKYEWIEGTWLGDGLEYHIEFNTHYKDVINENSVSGYNYITCLDGTGRRIWVRKFIINHKKNEIEAGEMRFRIANKKQQLFLNGSKYSLIKQEVLPAEKEFYELIKQHYTYNDRWYSCRFNCCYRIYSGFLYDYFDFIKSVRPEYSSEIDVVKGFPNEFINVYYLSYSDKKGNHEELKICNSDYKELGDVTGDFSYGHYWIQTEYTTAGVPQVQWPVYYDDEGDV